ncbi:glycosyltransferase family 4 protein [Peredibacter sp. HCB2-198]|uniref:glycosyltransferase family 4 protein n=1 Tax=Peredibacter sp. HCB2-198 TaxID=3383025 RepID=UPI0038B49479
MKILVVSQYYFPENFRINDLCKGLVERGHEVTVYTGLPNYPEGKLFQGYSFKGPYTEEIDGIKVIRVPLITRGAKKSFRLALNYLSYFVSATVLAPFLVKGEFDKIFVFAPSPITVAIPALFLKFLKRAPVFLWVQDLWPESLEATGVVRNKFILDKVGFGVKLLYKLTDKILLPSKAFIKNVKDLGAKDSQIVYFAQWSESLFSNSPEESSAIDPLIPKDGFKITFAGNIGTSQDFETIVKTAEILRNHKNIIFLILGNGLMRGWAESEVKRLGIEDTFIFLGSKPLEMMPYYYSKSDVMLLSLKDTPLFAVTVPAKFQSYLASGKPILASVSGEVARIVNEYNVGISVPAGNANLLAEAVLKLKNSSPETLRQMASNAKICHEENFERETQIDLLEKIMETTKFS